MSPESGAGCPELATAKRALGNGTLLQPSRQDRLRCSSGMAAPEAAEGEGKHCHRTLPQYWLCQGAPPGEGPRKHHLEDRLRSRSNVFWRKSGAGLWCVGTG